MLPPASHFQLEKLVESETIPNFLVVMAGYIPCCKHHSLAGSNLQNEQN